MHMQQKVKQNTFNQMITQSHITTMLKKLIYC